MLIAEEKEKNTLRTLMLSAVSPLEFLTGKALITLFVSLLYNALMFFVIGIDKKYFGLYMLFTTLVVFTMIEIGALLGIMSQNQMAMSVVGLPIIGVFLIIPLLAKSNKIVGRIVKLLPNYSIDILLKKVFNGEQIGMESIYNIVVILIWIIIAGAAFAYAYNKKGIDK
jgi:ABC-2 type transport system permease protein